MTSGSPDRVALSGSARVPVDGAVMREPIADDTELVVTVLLRRRSDLHKLNDLLMAHPAARSHLERETFAARHGADPADVDSVKQFAAAHGLTVAGSDLAQRRVDLRGPARSFRSAFSVDLARWEYPGGSYRGRTGHVRLPRELTDVVQGVFGLDDRPMVRPHVTHAQPTSGDATIGGYYPDEVARLYRFPDATDGRGFCIAIVQFGGGYRQEDLDRYFSARGVQPPAITVVSVGGGANSPSGEPGDRRDSEVTLDIQVAGAAAPGARLVLYFAPNNDRGYLDAVSQAVHDTANSPHVLSISWGQPEARWTQQSLSAIDAAFQDAAAIGMTVCTSVGDAGSSDGISDGSPHVDFPASSPHVLGCGGTRLATWGQAVSDETVWASSGGATGGGRSTVFPQPPYQANVGPASQFGRAAPARAVPDVAANADPQSGYRILLNGREQVVGGTSAAAPLWAALVARLDESSGRPLGFLNTFLYGLATNTGAFRDITSGSNGAYSAGPGWDPCTGLGSPVGEAIAAELNRSSAQSAAASSDPR